MHALKHANYGVAISSSSSAQQKCRITSVQAEDGGWNVRRETMRGRKVGETSGMTLAIKEPGQKVRRVPTALYRLLCLGKARRPEKKKVIGT